MLAGLYFFKVSNRNKHLTGINNRLKETEFVWLECAVSNTA